MNRAFLRFRQFGRLDDAQVMAGTTALSVGDRSAFWKTPQDYGAAADGTTDDGPAIQAACTAITNAGGGRLYFPTGTYRVATAVTSGATVHWVMMGGVVNAVAAVTINGGVDVVPFHTRAFTVASATAANSLLKIRTGSEASQYVEAFSPFWFDGNDIGVQINKCFQVGAGKTRCVVPPGTHTLSTTIKLSETDYGSHLILEGHSFIATTLSMPANNALCGIDCSGSDECEIRHIRVIEGTGSKVGMCIALGGTSLKVNDCWTGNAKYGLYQNRGSGTRITNHFSENSEFEYHLEPNHDESSNISGAPSPSGGVSDVQISGGKLHSSDATCLRVAQSGSNIVRGFEVNGVTLNGGATYCLEVSDTGGAALGVKGFRMIGGQIQQAASGSASCGARVNNCDAAFIGTVFEGNNDTGLKAAGSVEVELIGCFFGNYSGSVQTTATATESGSPTITETASVTL